MKQISKITINNVLLDLEAFEDIYRNDDFFSKRKIELRSLQNKYNGLELEIVTYLYNNFDQILVYKPQELQNLIEEFNRRRYSNIIFTGKGKKKSKLQIDLETVFYYKSLRSNKNSILQKFGDALGIRVCLYCNISHALKIVKNTATILFEFDHFFSKDKYPYIACSMYNLIPCCSTCNKSKSSKFYRLNQLLHPYKNDFDSFFTFSTNPKQVIDCILNGENLKKVKLEIINRLNDEKIFKNSELDKILGNYNSIFKLIHLYENFKDIVEDIILKSYYYNKDRLADLASLSNETLFSPLKDKTIIARFILGIYPTKEQINLRSLSKLIYDLSERTNLLKNILLAVNK